MMHGQANIKFAFRVKYFFLVGPTDPWRWKQLVPSNVRILLSQRHIVMF